MHTEFFWGNLSESKKITLEERDDDEKMRSGLASGKFLSLHRASW
jgi:hypothetical protein